MLMIAPVGKTMRVREGLHITEQIKINQLKCYKETKKKILSVTSVNSTQLERLLFWYFLSFVCLFFF